MDAFESSIYFSVLVTTAVLITMIIAFIILTTRQGKELRQSRQQGKSLRIKGQEEERQRLSGELHDGISTIITGIRYMISALPENPDKRKQQLGTVCAKLDEVISQIKTISENLRPPCTSEAGLRMMVMQYLSGLPHAFTQRTTLHIQEFPAELLTETTSVFRIIQELLCNAMKHAGDCLVFLSLTIASKKMVLHYADNGAGFNPATPARNGRANISNRVEALAGEIILETAPGKGTEYLILLPIKTYHP